MARRNSLRLAASQSHSPSPISASRASSLLNPLWGPRKKMRPPTMPTQGRWPRTLSGWCASWPQMTAVPPAMNSAKESPTPPSTQSSGGAKRGLCLVIVMPRAPMSPAM